MMIALALALSASPPSAEAEALGAKVARIGAAASILPLMVAKETDELVAQHPELSAADTLRLRAAAGRAAHAGFERIFTASGHAYAAAMTVEDLRAVVAFEQSPAAMRYRAAMPRVIAESMKSVGAIDFKADALASFCAETGKLCAAK